MAKNKSTILGSIRETVLMCEAARKGPNNPQDITLGEVVKERWQMSMESFYEDLGINPEVDTIENIMNMPDSDLRWIVPEIFRDAIRAGYRAAPIYRNLLIAEQSVKGMNVQQPWINMMDAAPQYTGVAETIRFANISFGQKSVGLFKLTRGVSIPYEVRNFCSLNIVAIFLQDFGTLLGQGLDTLAIQTLINGDQSDGSDSTAVIGVTTPNTLVYRDMLRPYIRMARLGKNITTLIAGEDMALDLLDLPEFKIRQQGIPEAQLNIHTPIPSRSDVYIHSAIPTNQLLMVTPTKALIKYNAQQLLVESEKIVSNQTDTTYASLITGFGTAFRDARLLIDKSEDIAHPDFDFPAIWTLQLAEAVQFTK